MIKTQVLLCVILILGLSYCDDIYKGFEQIVREHGYPVEQHYITTSDGYILKMFRIPHGKNQTANEDEIRPAILVQHGIFDSADFVISHGPDNSPAFYLANLGYDVWISNSRGNKYSKQHVSLDPDRDPQFWDFSFFEMIEDDKANINFVLQQTGVDKVAFIGHSQGTSQMYAGLSTQNDWFRERVSIYISLGSVSRLDHTTSGLIKFLISTDIAIPAIKALGIHEMFPSNFLTKPVFIALCGTVPTI